ncbi:MAG: LysM peptidoglycan-binding domain-containing M23 family metallopeptidase [Anaerolineales bacterium]
MARKKTGSVLLAMAALLLAMLACAREDVGVQEGMGTSNPAQIQTPSSTSTIDPGAGFTQADVFPPSPTTTATPAAPEPLVSPTFPPTAVMPETQTAETLLYQAQPGDTLWALAVRFGVLPEDITAADGELPEQWMLIDADRLLLIPNRLGATGPDDWLIPDSEMVFSPHAADFDVSSFVAEQGGYLNRYREYLGGRRVPGPEVVVQAALDNTTNPRLLLAILEYQTGWVTDPTTPTGDALEYPLGHIDRHSAGLYRQLTWLANELGHGYYGWRAGTITELAFLDETVVRLDPSLNAGTVALQYYLSRLHSGASWVEALGETGFTATYMRLFGDPWSKSHPLYEPGVSQPTMILPFLEGRKWYFTGGPHGAWVFEAAWAALDFAPGLTAGGCEVSIDWAVAAAPGLVVRSENGVVALDMDGDGREQTGWVLIYLHIAAEGRVREGSFLEAGDLIGHPSCEGGPATGTHIHIARKYNGEWILADGPLPFTLSDWSAKAGVSAYQGALVRGDEIVLASPWGAEESAIRR